MFKTSVVSSAAVRMSNVSGNRKRVNTWVYTCCCEFIEEGEWYTIRLSQHKLTIKF